MSLIVGGAIAGKALVGTKAAVAANAGLVKAALLTSIAADILSTGCLFIVTSLASDLLDGDTDQKDTPQSCTGAVK